jgi:hypothetical protein
MNRAAMEELPRPNSRVFRFGLTLAFFIVLYISAIIAFIIIY